MCKASCSSFSLPSFVQVPIASKFIIRRMITRGKEVKMIKLRLIAVSDHLAYDLLRNVWKTTYCSNAICQTDSNPTISVQNMVSENIQTEVNMPNTSIDNHHVYDNNLTLDAEQYAIMN